MRKIKPIKEVSGTIAYRLEKGYRAVICCSDGNTFFTSLVEDIRNSSVSGIEIETMNTIYKLTYAHELPCAV